MLSSVKMIFLNFWDLRSTRKNSKTVFLHVLFELELNLSKSFEFTNIQLSLLELSKSTFLTYNFMVEIIAVVSRFSITIIATDESNSVYLCNKLCPLANLTM